MQLALYGYSSDATNPSTDILLTQLALLQDNLLMQLYFYGNSSDATGPSTDLIQLALLRMFSKATGPSTDILLMILALLRLFF